MSQRTRQQMGHVPGPLIILGTLALLVTVVSEFLGVFTGLDEAMKYFLTERGVHFRTNFDLISVGGIFISVLTLYGLAASLLNTPGNGRRLVVGATALCLVMGLSFVFAVWGIAWSPVSLALGVLWACFSTMVYAGFHHMPCDGVLTSEAGNVIAIDGNRAEETVQQHKIDG